MFPNEQTASLAPEFRRSPRHSNASTREQSFIEKIRASKRIIREHLKMYVRRNLTCHFQPLSIVSDAIRQKRSQKLRRKLNELKRTVKLRIHGFPVRLLLSEEPRIVDQDPASMNRFTSKPLI